jgi:hypothetical protein
VAVPEGFRLEATDEEEEEAIDLEQKADADVSAFLVGISRGSKLDDREHPKPKPSVGYSTRVSLPVPNSWISVYRTQVFRNIVLFLNSTKNTPGYYAMQAIAHDWAAIKDELGASVFLDRGLWINDRMHAGLLDQPDRCQRVFSWLAKRVTSC